jgi:hypothetical protein
MPVQKPSHLRRFGLSNDNQAEVRDEATADNANHINHGQTIHQMGIMQ